MDPLVKHLLSLQAIRERARIVWQAAEAGELVHFDLHPNKLDDVADFVISVIERDFGPDRYTEIPPHGRWQHFDVGNVPRIQNMIDSWKAADEKERTRRLIDLFFVSVLLDAGAGDYWRFVEPGTDRTYERSEGIAVASLYLFEALAFTDSTDQTAPSVNANGLKNLTDKELAAGFQVSQENPMLGIDSRAALLRSLGGSLGEHSDVFGEQGRPGNLVDYMIATADDPSELDVLKLWDVLQTLLIPCWPKDRTTVNGCPIGDAWPLSTLQKQADSSDVKDSSTSGIQPFHKLTQWLTYSLMVPFQRILGLKWKNAEHLTALAEYRNGGLFVDLGVLTLKKEAYERGIQASGQDLPLFDATDDVIVEWRALTLSLLDRVYEIVGSRMGPGVHLTIAQFLEAGTWKSGREIAAQRRPKTKSSPILIKSDGTVF